MWSKQYNASLTPGLDSTSMNNVMEALKVENPEAWDNATTLVHGDFRLDNMILREDQPAVAAVLDWELCVPAAGWCAGVGSHPRCVYACAGRSTIGHPLADLAHSMLPYHLPHIPNSPVTGFGMPNEELSAAGLPSEEEFVRKYVACLATHLSNHRSDFTPPEEWLHITESGLPKNWHFFTSFALFRVAAILQVGFVV